MDNDKLIKEIETIKKSVEQMRADDIEDNPEAAYEDFPCDCCGETKLMAGSLIYGNYRLCNDCVLLAETSFAMKKITKIEELMEKMDDTKFENQYNAIFEQDDHSMN